MIKFWLLLLGFFYLGLKYLLKIPPIWPDEALFADSALNILHGHLPGTALLTGTLPGALEFGFGYPPLFFYLLSFWFKIVGFSITNQRLLSLIFSVFFLILVFLLMKLLLPFQTKSKFWSFLPLLTIILLLSDMAFLKTSLISRPEIVVLLSGTLAIYCFIKKKFFYSGLILGIGFLFHYLAIIFILSLAAYQLLKRSNPTFLIIAFIMPVLIWLFLIRNNLHYLLSDLTLRWQYGGNQIIWLRAVFAGTDNLLKAIYIIYMLIWLESLNVFFSIDKLRIRLVTIILSISWLLSYLWHTEFAFITVIVFSYISLTILIYENFVKVKKLIYGFIFISLISLNIIHTGQQLLVVDGDKYDYQLFMQSIMQNIPDQKSVYLSSIPDAYFAFKQERHNVLSEFPFLPTSPDALRKVLDNSDYIVFSYPFESLVTQTIVPDYIEKNKQQVIKIGGQNQYEAEVIKLIPKDQRVK